ncbi:MAG TPA: hypothetical protein VG125_29920, partial [Pirellulales bacterium]|nr:hypothetical protein [Pirellulales bacterium]
MSVKVPRHASNAVSHVTSCDTRLVHVTFRWSERAIFGGANGDIDAITMLLHPVSKRPVSQEKNSNKIITPQTTTRSCLKIQLLVILWQSRVA